MLRHSLDGAVTFISLQHFIAPALDLMPCLQARGMRDCKAGKAVVIKYCKEIKITAQYQCVAYARQMGMLC